jgi:hypothetical protein
MREPVTLISSRTGSSSAAVVDWPKACPIVAIAATRPVLITKNDFTANSPYESMTLLYCRKQRDVRTSEYNHVFKEEMQYSLTG